jgi:hypothetical protein
MDLRYVPLWALADYGRSFMWPLAWLFVSVFIFHFGYALILAPLKQKVDPANKDYYDRAVCMLALGNAVPFVGHLSIDAGIKKSLYCPDNVCGERAPIPPLGIEVLVIVQNVVSIALIFLFGLAMRNYFKIKWWTAVKGCLKLVRFVSTPVIENSEPNFRKGSRLCKNALDDMIP